MNINLLATKDGQKLTQSKPFIYGVIFILLLFFSLIFFIQYHARQSIRKQDLINQQLKQDFNKLKIDYQASLLGKIRPNFVKKTLKHVKTKPREKKLFSQLLQINYAKAVDLAILLRDKENSFLSERGHLVSDNRTNTIWIEDTDESLIRIKNFIKNMDVAKKQVLIEARLVNMTKDSAEDLGLRFGLLDSSKGHDNSSTTNISKLVNVDLAALPLDATPASVGIALMTLGKNVLLDMELSALESEGKAEIIASPRLLAMNQEPAIIESGEDIPYQEYTASGATSVSFKKAVLSLKVVPQITSDGKLMMSLLISQDSDSGKRVQGVPIIITKSIETNVMVNDLQTIVLGGIYKQDKNNSIIRVPFFSNLPIIRHIFKRTQVRMKNEELLIFITPKILALK